MDLDAALLGDAERNRDGGGSDAIATDATGTDTGPDTRSDTGSDVPTDVPAGSVTLSELRAFPTAVGFARDVSTFRDGEVRKVTTTADRGPGSLREALETPGAAIIIFEVDGVITLESTLVGTNDKYIAGQTAFQNGGRGITLRRDGSHPDPVVSGPFGNIVWRFIRFRGGEGVDHEENGDNYQPYLGSGLHMLDHCSFSWSTDENVSFSSTDGYTVQYSIISEGLAWASHVYSSNPAHPDYPLPHSKGSLTDDTPKCSFIGNLFAHNNDRNPVIVASTSVDTEIELVNNYFYNRGIFGVQLALPLGGGGVLKADVINNFWQDGPNSSTARWGFLWPNLREYNGRTSLRYDDHRLHVAGNLSPRRSAGESEWNVVGAWDDNSGGTSESVHGVPSRLHSGTGTSNAVPADAIKTSIFPHVGVSLYRDAADLRVLESVETNAGSIVNGDGDDRGGFPQFTAHTGGWASLEQSNMSAPPVDADGNGIPDTWVSAYTIDNRAGYSALELYLAEIAGDFDRLP